MDLYNGYAESNKYAVGKSCKIKTNLTLEYTEL